MVCDVLRLTTPSEGTKTRLPPAPTCGLLKSPVGISASPDSPGARPLGCSADQICRVIRLSGFPQV